MSKINIEFKNLFQELAKIDEDSSLPLALSNTFIKDILKSCRASGI
ncbi:MAG: hypothetical protein KKH92_04490 [Firmicutes bacterium]|nr:hypothetical protein [Bacillota bacterium]